MVSLEAFEKLNNKEKAREIEHVEILLKYSLRAQEESGSILFKEQSERIEEMLTLLYYMRNKNEGKRSKRKRKKSK